MITVDRAAPLLTVQDRGRVGLRADGVTTSGPLDRLAHAVANALTGNADRAATLEGCLGGASFTFGKKATFALTGAELAVTLNGHPIATYVAYEASAGAVLLIERPVRGAVWYLAVRGGVDAPFVLGSRSTLVSAGIGGLDGAPIRAGTRIEFADDVGNPVAPAPALLAVPEPLRTSLGSDRIPLVAGPRGDALDPVEWSEFFDAVYSVSRSSSRVGYRLEGPPIPARLPADLASEPACAGAMQLPPEGQPIVLMADHPTVGGYPIIAVVPEHALGRLAQRVPGATVQFEREATDHALAHVRAQREIFVSWQRAHSVVPFRQ